MKLEKFDYQIGNKKQKNQFVFLGVLCIALIVTVVLYKTFANFSSSASYNIISSQVGDIANNRNEIVRVDISKEGEGNEVYAILYDDDTLSIDGTGYMKDFEGNDLIGEVLDAFIAVKVSFTEDEQTFINNNKKFMGTMFDYAAREFLARDDGALNTAINNHQYVDENNNPVSDGASKCQSLMTKVKNAGFAINKIEIINNVKNIGKNAFSLVKATATSDVRENSYTGNYIAWDYKCNQNASERINLLSLEANLEEVGEDAMLDLNENNINIGENVTVIPNDMFAGYNGGNMIFCSQPPYSANYKRANLDLTIPDNVQVIGVNAFYAYDGSSITFPANLQEIDEYAFANYYGNDITLPAGTTTLKENAFRDFNKKINMSNCPANKLFAPNANIYSNNTLCVFN